MSEKIINNILNNEYLTTEQEILKEILIRLEKIEKELGI